MFKQVWRDRRRISAVRRVSRNGSSIGESRRYICQTSQGEFRRTVWIYFSTRYKVASEGTSLSSIPMLWILLRLWRPNSMISARLTQPLALLNIISMIMSASLWRMLPLLVLRKSKTDDAKAFSSSRILLRVSNLFPAFVLQTVMCEPCKRDWLSVMILLVTIWLSTLKLRKKNCHLTKF